MPAKKTKTTKQTSKPAKQSIGRKLLFGSVISSDFIVRHWLKIFVLMILIMIYISTKYQCQTGMETIRRLQNNLEVVKTERIRQRSTYMSRIRESAMQELADSIRPGLSVQTQPPYHLKATANAQTQENRADN